MGTSSVNRVRFAIGHTVPKEIIDLLNDKSLFRDVPDIFFSGTLVEDAFYADGTPKRNFDNLIFPVYAPVYSGTPIPSPLLEVSSMYRHTASEAALSWGLAMLNNGTPVDLPKQIDGEVVKTVVNGKELAFCVPYLSQDSSAIIIPFPDTRDNDPDWDDGVIPTYAEQQAYVSLWVYDQIAKVRPLNISFAYIVRITGNTPGDISVYKVFPDEQEEYALIQKIANCKNFPQANIKQSLKWYERKEEDLRNGLSVQDDNAYKIFSRYLQKKEQRKAIDAQVKEIQSQMDSISVLLASQIEPKIEVGTFYDKKCGIKYSVTHKAKRAASKEIPSGLVKQLYPELWNSVITRSISKRGKIHIEYLTKKK